MLDVIVGAVVGGISVWGIAYCQFRAGRDSEDSKRKHDARLTVEAVISKLENSRLYSLEPHYEIWERGFESLDETRSLIRHANARTVRSKDVSTALVRMEDIHRPLIDLRDSIEKRMANCQSDEINRFD